MLATKTCTEASEKTVHLNVCGAIMRGASGAAVHTSDSQELLLESGDSVLAQGSRCQTSLHGARRYCQGIELKHFTWTPGGAEINAAERALDRVGARTRRRLNVSCGERRGHTVTRQLSVRRLPIHKEAAERKGHAMR